MIVVVHPLIDRRGLLADNLERGMRVQQGQGSGEAAVGDSVDAQFAVVVGDVFDEPIHGVVSIVGFVGLFWIFGVVLRGEEKGAFGFESAAQILPDKDVAVGGEFLPTVRYPIGAVLLGAFVEVLLSENAIRGAREQDGEGLGLIGFGDHDGLQVHPVAHGDHEFLNAVVTLWGCGRRVALLRLRGEEGDAEDGQVQNDAHETSGIGLYSGIDL
jgi:hypothetical protein